MEKKMLEQIQKKIGENLSISENGNFIEKLFDERAEEIHKTIKRNAEYSKYIKQVRKLDNEIQSKFDNAWDIIEIIEKYAETLCESGYICEKLMYKHGIYDGISFVLEGLKEINDTKFLKNNSFENFVGNDN